MNTEYQKIIVKFKDRLKQRVDLKKLRPLLVERNISNESGDPDEFYNSLCSRDPYAFLKFIHILSQNGYVEEATLLQDECSRSCTTPPTYKMSSNPVGLCLIINNILFEVSRIRHESQIDVSALDSLFQSLGFKVTIEQNLTAQEMTNCLKKLSINPELGKVDSIIVYILTHGGRNKKHNVDILRGIDEKEVVLKNVYKMFNHSNCEMLVGKPKMFFFQNCRGKKVDGGHFFKELQFANTDITTFKTNDNSSLKIVLVPSITDTIVVHSTMPCHLSITDELLGSWLCQELVHVFTIDHSRHDLFTMLNTICKRMEDKTSDDKLKQTIHIELFGVSGIVKFGQSSKCTSPTQFILEVHPSGNVDLRNTRNLVCSLQTNIAPKLIPVQRIEAQFIPQRIAEPSCARMISEPSHAQRIAEGSHAHRIAEPSRAEIITEPSRALQDGSQSRKRMRRSTSC